jgi:hypothetical protein
MAAFPPYRIEQTIPTNQGRSVHVAVLEDGRRVFVKRAHTPEWADDLERQARHYLVMAEVLGPRSVYPEVLGLSDTELIIPLYEHGAVEQLAFGSHVQLMLPLTRRALRAVFELAAAARPGWGPDERRTAAASFMPAEARRRLERLRRAVETARGARWLASRMPGRADTVAAVLEASTRWITDERLVGQSGTLAPAELGLASHGDFGLNNVMLAEPAASTAALVFIDTRGHWYGGYPWWDPVMDLATLIAFHCRIEPAIGRVAGLAAGGPDLPGRLCEDQVRSMARSDPAVAAWSRRDPRWEARLEALIAVRLLGNVSVQLTTAPADAEQRAARVLALYEAQSERVRELLTAL